MVHMFFIYCYKFKYLTVKLQGDFLIQNRFNYGLTEFNEALIFVSLTKESEYYNYGTSVTFL